MRFQRAAWAFLIVSVHSTWHIVANPEEESPLLPGTPLSESEYGQFFKPLRAPYRASATCFIRALYGCQTPLIQRLDQYENHGVIPHGPVCSDLPETPFFPDFCTFTFYRCTMKKYFVKRVVCPEETQSKPGRTRTFKKGVTASGSLFSTTKSSPHSSTTAAIGLPTPSGTELASNKDILSPTALQSNSDAGVLLLFSQSPPKPGSIPGNLPVNQIRKEAKNGEQQRGRSRTQESHLPTNDLEDLFLRLQDHNVQHLMQEMEVLLARVKTAGEQEIQATSLKLLMALNHADVHQEAKPTVTEIIEGGENEAAEKEQP